jgi:hypothetical protein
MLRVTNNPFMLSFVRLNVVMLSVVAPSRDLNYKTFFAVEILIRKLVHLSLQDTPTLF